jgi:hypothetical protein
MSDEPHKAFSEGVEAHAAGKLEDANPYGFFSSSFALWRRGWIWRDDGVANGTIKPEVKPAPVPDAGGAGGASS